MTISLVILPGDRIKRNQMCRLAGNGPHGRIFTFYSVTRYNTILLYINLVLIWHISIGRYQKPGHISLTLVFRWVTLYLLTSLRLIIAGMLVPLSQHFITYDTYSLQARKMAFPVNGQKLNEGSKRENLRQSGGKEERSPGRALSTEGEIQPLRLTP